jgi:hypothetical protein
MFFWKKRFFEKKQSCAKKVADCFGSAKVIAKKIKYRNFETHFLFLRTQSLFKETKDRFKKMKKNNSKKTKIYEKISYN